MRSGTLGEAWLPEVLFESGWDREKGVGGPGRLHPQLHYVTARLFNRQLLAGDGRAGASWFLGSSLRPWRGPGAEGPRGSPTGTSVPPGRRQGPLLAPPPIYMLIVSGKSSFIGRIRQSNRVVSQAEPN